jgi:hypothetical protein
VLPQVDTDKFYKLLGVGKDADADTIRKAYRKLALKVGEGGGGGGGGGGGRSPSLFACEASCAHDADSLRGQWCATR